MYDLCLWNSKSIFIILYTALHFTQLKIVYPHTLLSNYYFYPFSDTDDISLPSSRQLLITLRKKENLCKSSFSQEPVKTFLCHLPWQV